MNRIAYLLFPLVVTGCSAPAEGDPMSRGVSALGVSERGVSASGVAAKRRPVPRSYVDLSDYASATDEGAARYDAVVASLQKGFDDICGDTFCEGDYSNLQSLRFRCSVAKGDGRLGSCVWVFAGSYEDVAPETGIIEVNAKTFQCAIPVEGTAEAFLATLAAAGDDALYAPLPGAATSVYDALADCL